MSWDETKLMAGGGLFDSKEHIFYPPNLTPDPTTGHIYDWTEAGFVRRFKMGKVYKDSPMPWYQYKEITEPDLKAMFLYLKSIDPIQNDPGPVVTKKESGEAVANKGS